MSKTNSKSAKGANEAVNEVREFYTRTRRYDESVLGKETPVLDLGERADYDLKTEEGARLYEMGRYSTEATDDLGRKSRARSFSFGSFTLRRGK